jgi:hypothetical protein
LDRRFPDAAYACPWCLVAYGRWALADEPRTLTEEHVPPELDFFPAAAVRDHVGGGADEIVLRLMPVRGYLGRRDGWQPAGGCLHVARRAPLAVYP